MVALDRRTVLKGAAAAGVMAWAGPFSGYVAGPVQATSPPAPLPLGPMPDLRDGLVRLWLPPGFEYRSFHDTEVPVTLDDGTPLPGRHDGMAAFRGRHGNVILVRNHEVNNPGPAMGPPDGSAVPYDAMARGGTTTIVVTKYGEVLRSFTSLNGTQMNCSGGPTPWGSWITCEETVNGPDVGPDFTGAPNIPLTKPHGYLFEVPAWGTSSREPITRAGRFAHEAIAVDPHSGTIYMTEDNFGFPSGFYRFRPRFNPMRKGHRRQPRTAADARRARHAERRPRRCAAGGRQLRRAVGRHRRAGSVVPVHTRRDGADRQRHGDQLRRRARPSARRRRLLAPGGRLLRQRHRLLHVDPGRWCSRDAAWPRSPTAGATATVRCGRIASTAGG